MPAALRRNPGTEATLKTCLGSTDAMARTCHHGTAYPW
jgi:hypothetical protein